MSVLIDEQAAVGRRAEFIFIPVLLLFPLRSHSTFPINQHKMLNKHEFMVEGLYVSPAKGRKFLCLPFPLALGRFV